MAQEEVRRRAVALVGEGRSQGEVARLLDVSRQSVNEWVAAHRRGGEQALAARRRGRRQGEKTVLTPRQQTQIAKAIRDRNPNQLRLPGFLWTRALVCELIERRFGVRVTEKTAGRYLRVWTFIRRSRRGARWSRTRSWSRAGWRSATRSWSGAPTASGRCCCGPTRWVALRPQRRTFLGAGRADAARSGRGQRFGANVISAISNKGRLQFSVFKARFTARC